MPWLMRYVAPAGNEITEPLGTPATNELSWDATSDAPLASIEDGTLTVRVVVGTANGRLGSAGGGGVGAAVGFGVGVGVGVTGTGVGAGVAVVPPLEPVVMKTLSPETTSTPEAVVDRTR